MQQLNEFLLSHRYMAGNNWFIFLLLGTGLFHDLLAFPQIRYFRHAIRT